jgi:hypothetical protein
MPELLSLAVCVSDEVTLSDFITPIEILTGLNDGDNPMYGAAMGEIPYRIAIDYLSPTMDPVVSLKGANAPTFNPTHTYTAAIASGKQYDILWVPAGMIIHYVPATPLTNPSTGPFIDLATGESRIPKEEIEFIKQQAPKAKYIMSVCGGAIQLALAGVLSGKRATTNKAGFRAIVVRSFVFYHYWAYYLTPFISRPPHPRTSNGLPRRVGWSMEMSGPGMQKNSITARQS